MKINYTIILFFYQAVFLFQSERMADYKDFSLRPLPQIDPSSKILPHAIPKKFIGKWVNEGEQSTLVISESGSCKVSYLDMENDNQDVETSGVVKVSSRNNDKIFVSWSKPFFGQKKTSYIHKKTDSQSLLFEVYTPEKAKLFGVSETFAFAKTSD